MLQASCQFSELLRIEKRQDHNQGQPLFPGKELAVRYKQGLSLWKDLHTYLEVKVDSVPDILPTAIAEPSSECVFIRQVALLVKEERQKC